MGEGRERRLRHLLIECGTAACGRAPLSPPFPPRARAHARAHIECRASIPGALRACVHPTRPAAWCACGYIYTNTNTQAGCGEPGFHSGAESDGVPCCITDTAIVQLYRIQVPSSTAPGAQFHGSVFNAETNSALLADGGASVVACKVR